MQESPFGRPQSWRDSDLIGVSREFDVDLVLAGYRHGVFPMPSRRGLMGWYSPLRRGILPLGGLRVTRSLRKTAKRYEITVDTDFEGVLGACADSGRIGAWIDRDIARVYRTLHAAGVVHSVEAWTADGVLAGGLYGVSIGGLFAGESMFHHPELGRDASKAALIGLVDLLTAAGAPHRLLDVQWQTPHLETLGVIEVDRSHYLGLLEQALPLPTPDWPAGLGARTAKP